MEIVHNGFIFTRCFDDDETIFASNFLGIGKEDRFKSYGAQEIKMVVTEAPRVGRIHNMAVYGFDFIRCKMQEHLIFIPSTKWTLPAIMHFLELAILASFKEYQRDGEINGLSHRKQINYNGFKHKLCTAILLASKNH